MVEKKASTRKSLYKEPAKKGNPYRQKNLAQFQELIKNKQNESTKFRRQFFQPDFRSVSAYETSLVSYRKQLKKLLGWPLTRAVKEKPCLRRRLRVGKDSLGVIERFWIDCGYGLSLYGLFFRPQSPGPVPLVISQHGGGGTPELTAGFFGSANYNEMTRRVLYRKVAVWAPQLFLWKKDFGPECDHLCLDRKLKHLGGSLAALEIYRLQRSLDILTRLPGIDKNKIGMIGLSYGGFYSLLLAAIDVRIKVTISSCYFNDRFLYDFGDWIWFNSANFFLDEELACLVCPRPLYIEVGKKDPMFSAKTARPIARLVAAVYKKLGVPRNFVYNEFQGGHELDRAEKNIDFLFRHLQD
ncbi:MAG: hypothetical protein NC911_04605 [Candidatus Omnitrophica bacterium]|nr:hypothetical protein [Candidatus Omnitrophota bacterium]